MHRAIPTLSLLLSSLLLPPSTFASPLPAFTPSPEFNEQTLDRTLPHDVLLHTVAPADFDPAKPTHHILYLLPNGNTIPQTLGRLLTPTDDWHFDIQHIAAQTRLLRSLDPSRNTVLTLLQAPGKSWPKFRADHKDDNPQLIRALVAESLLTNDRDQLLTDTYSLSLVAHSGGGSFITGLLNHPDPLPSVITRIAYLDANYSYSTDEGHGTKLLTWLRASPSHHLVVFAYDDRNVTLNGKKIVSDTGGTHRATHRMLTYLNTQGLTPTPTTPPSQGESGRPRPATPTATTPTPSHPFTHLTSLNNQAHFFLHPNPDLKILHTAMIGELNAYLVSLTTNTPLAPQTLPLLAGPRAYTQFVSRPTPTPVPPPVAGASRPRLPEPSETPKPSSNESPPSTRATGDPPVSSPSSSSSLTLNLPPRPQTAPTGSQLLEKIQHLSTPDREELIIQQILSGNVPTSLRTLVPITVTAPGPDAQHTATYYVTPDVLAVGSDTDSFRTPLTPMAAQRIATALDCSLITRKISNDIHAHAIIKLDPHPLTKDREAPATLYQHHQIIESQLANLKKQQGGPAPSSNQQSAIPNPQSPPPLIAGHKKDIVLTPRQSDKPNKVAIYGWHYPTGKPIQPLYLGHVDWYVDYSHGTRLLSNHLLVDQHPTTLPQVLASPTLSPLLSDEGPTPHTYPSTRPANPPAKPSTSQPR